MRVAIVNDQRLATEALRRVVLSDPAHEIAWTAEDGQEAVDRCNRDRPDVILMDLVMPVMNGAGATLLSKLTSVNEIRCHLDAVGSRASEVSDHAVAEASPAGRPVPLVAIGASTGGPQALERILSTWPDGFPAAVIVAQHIGADFAASLVHWLAEKSRLTISSSATRRTPPLSRAGNV